MFGTPSQILAEEKQVFVSQEEIKKTNEKNIAKYAESFVHSAYETTEFEVGNVITMYNEDDNISGYCVDVNRKGVQNGYVVVKFCENEPVISEFCIGDNVKNPYDDIIAESQLDAENLVFYSIGANEYHIYSLRENKVTGLGKEVISKKEYDEYKTRVKDSKKEAKRRTFFGLADTDKSITNYTALDGWTVVSNNYEGSVIDSRTITGASSLTYFCSADVSNAGKTYACSVVALCNLMKYYKARGYDKIESSFSTLYDIMWTKAGTSTTGGTTDGNEAIAAKKYLNELGYTCSYNSYWFDNYSDFTRDIMCQQPCIFTYGALFNGVKGGHAVLVVGYVNTSSYRYLQIADGWNSYLRYINFNGYDYYRKNGWSFSISK